LSIPRLELCGALLLAHTIQNTHYVLSSRINRLNRWQLIRQRHQSYWKRWSREYLSTLQSRHKWFKQSPNLKIDDLVIVEAPSRSPTEWRLARIIDIHPGCDEVVRVVFVRTQDGVFKRPVVKLVRLPIEPWPCFSISSISPCLNKTTVFI